MAADIKSITLRVLMGRWCFPSNFLLDFIFNLFLFNLLVSAYWLGIKLINRPLKDTGRVAQKKPRVLPLSETFCLSERMKPRRTAELPRRRPLDSYSKPFDNSESTRERDREGKERMKNVVNLESPEIFQFCGCWPSSPAARMRSTEECSSSSSSIHSSPQFLLFCPWICLFLFFSITLAII